MRRRMTRGTAGAAALVAGLLLVSAALASPTTYSSQASFLAALSGAPQTLDFESLAVGTTIPSGSTTGGITFTYSLGSELLQVRDDFGTTSPTHYLGVTSVDGTFLNGESFTMGFGGPITALGLYVIGAPDANIPGDFTLSATGSGSVTNTTPDVLLTDGDAYFLGIIDSAGFSEAQLSGNITTCDPDTNCQYVWNVDDITTSQAVFEPSPVLLIASSLAGLAGVTRKRRRQ